MILDMKLLVNLMECNHYLVIISDEIIEQCNNIESLKAFKAGWSVLNTTLLIRVHALLLFSLLKPFFKCIPTKFLFYSKMLWCLKLSLSAQGHKFQN